MNEFIFNDSLCVFDKHFKNETEFIEFLIRNDWIQEKIGITMPPTSGYYPDIYGTNRKTKSEVLVEVEYWAHRYRSKHSQDYRKSDFIVSYFRLPNNRFICNVPVISFYKGREKDMFLQYCLDEDLSTNFEELRDKNKIKRFLR